MEKRERIVHFLFDPKTLSLKYLFFNGSDLFSHVESINPYSFTNADFASYDNCKGYPKNPKNEFAQNA